MELNHIIGMIVTFHRKYHRYNSDIPQNHSIATTVTYPTAYSDLPQATPIPTPPAIEMISPPPPARVIVSWEPVWAESRTGGVSRRHNNELPVR